MIIHQLLDTTITRNASDLHLVVGEPPVVRINGELLHLPGIQPIAPDEIEGLIFPILLESQKEILLKNWELDLGLNYEGKARFRVNLYKQQGNWAGAFRLIPKQIRSLEETGLPAHVSRITELKQGFILVTGPTGQGKTTTLAAFINQINQTRNVHIVTIEDPVEFIYPKGKAIISQRELNSDTKSWANALKSALREDPDVLLIGEMRDPETIAAAITVAETGHLVFATLHTNSAAQTIDRIIDIFPANQQSQIKIQLAAVIEAVISQKLVSTISPGRILASELLFATPAVRSLIREGKTHLIDNLIQTSAEFGMRNLETSLAELVKKGIITTQTAQNYTYRPQLLNKLLGVAI